ncbi:MAG: hypothetical protein H7Y86_21700 [Rhizobacter sp.]|nr:hypothetical protein [Ferruginibacter sp.]
MTLLLLPLCNVFAQQDSALNQLQQLPAKYFKATEKKIDKYSHRISHKTEKTLTRLSKWEGKVQRLLQKVNPEAATKLFANEQLSFKGMLAQYKQGTAAMQGYKAGYDEYRDKLTTQFTYLDSNKNLLSKNSQQLLAATKNKTNDLEKEEQQNEALQKMIKERKQQLTTEAIKHLGKNKQLQKINKEAYYYAETLKNYKQIFNDKTKREETAKKLLEKIPGFSDFMRKNSMLASLFKMPDNYGTPQSLAGLQTRASVNSLIQTRIGAGGPNAMAEVRQNLQAAQAELTKLKDKILKAGGSSSNDELPDFKPNKQKTKTFLQRLEYGANVQFGKRNNYMPGTADIGLTLGYKLNDKSVIGLGLGYKLGMGSIDKIKFTHEGIGLRSFVDWKLKKQFFVSGGFEMNHNASFKNFDQLKDRNAWQQSGLIGISKKMALKTKLTKGTKLQLLYDVLHREHVPVSQPWVFRVGYDIK